MILRVLLLAALAIWGMTWSKNANAVINAPQTCGTVLVGWNGNEAIFQVLCWYSFWESGGGGGYYNPDGDPGWGGAGSSPYGGGTGLPPKAGYTVVGNVYVRLDRREILAQHAYSCATEHEVMAGVAQWSGGTTVGWQVEIQLADGKSQTWVRTNTSSYGWQPLTPCQ